MIHAKLGNTVYLIRFVAPSRLGNSTCGACEDPGDDKEFPEILINRDLDGETLIDTVLHEAIHAITWQYLNEQAVEQMATDLARLLVKVFDVQVRRRNDTQGLRALR